VQTAQAVAGVGVALVHETRLMTYDLHYTHFLSAELLHDVVDFSAFGSL
jgi:hypothetical protein